VFDDFKSAKLKSNKININYKIGGKGYPILMLHGYPQTHIMWRKVTPILSQDYTLVCPDLRGYGDSDKPPSDVIHRNYSKKEMAKDQAELMELLGFKEYIVIGHDRGARVAHRMGLDYQDKISKMVLMDIVPTNHVFENANMTLATRYYHWFFLIQKSPFPEKLIGKDPEFYLRSKLFMWGLNEQYISEDIINEYLRCFSNPDTIRASCEDYRAGATIDMEDHISDYHKKIECPLLILWGKKGTVEELYNPIEVWKKWAKNVQGFSIDCGHFIPEERPEETVNYIKNFIKN